jgi:pyruvate kinase
MNAVQDLTASGGRSFVPVETRRRTKIVATLGPATDTPELLDALVRAGMDAARLNCSHGEPDALRRRSTMVREAAERAGRPIALMFDLQGPKIRLVADTPERDLVVGQQVRFVAHAPDADAPTRDDDPVTLQVAFTDFIPLLTERSQIVVGDGTPRFIVLQRGASEVLTTVSAAGRVAPRKGVNVTHAQPTLPALTEKDLADLALAVECNADFVALSFVRTAEDVGQIRERLASLGSEARIIAKIEKVEAFENLESILEVADGVMVARGDYGVEAGLARVPLMQKSTIKQATQAGKLVITATQMLESMIVSPEPTRAEATDVANAVIDGTSAVMLSAETGIGAYPVEAVRAMAEFAEVAEEASEIFHATHTVERSEPDAAVMFAAVALASDVDAAALVIPTSTGGTPRACAKYRPRRLIIALAHHPRVANQLALEWGVHPRLMAAMESTDELVDHCIDAAKEIASLPIGSRLVVTAGPSTGRAGATNLILVREICEPG